MLTANFSKIKKIALPNITFILNEISENGIFLSKWAQEMLISKKRVLLYGII